MKSKVLILLLLLNLNLFAHKPTRIEDRDLGITMNVPEFLTKNWEISHTPTKAKLEVYHSGHDQEAVYFLVLGKLSLASVECDSIESLYSMIIHQAQLAFGEELEEDNITLTHLDSEREICPNIFVRSLNLMLSDDEDEFELSMDVHVLSSDEFIFFALAGVYSEMEESLLAPFSEALLETVHLIE